VPAQTVTTLYSFNGADGEGPEAALVQGTDGNLYGTTSAGGANGYGTVFKITPGGALTTLYSFCSLGSYPNCPDGAEPAAGLVQATNGNFYGTTAAGGTGACQFAGINGCGTAFKITPAGTLTTLYSFCAESGCTDGSVPYGWLVQAASGGLYGTTYSGGRNNAGTVFEIAPGGVPTTLHSFCALSECADGQSPYAGLVQATNGEFYGTTHGNNYSGTVFKITPTGVFTKLHSLGETSEVYGGLLQAANGDFYGTTFDGGANRQGRVFRMTPSATLITLHNFCAESRCTDGVSPHAGLIQATDGNLYGTTDFGGGYDAGKGGTLFKITPNGKLTTLYSFCPQSGCTDGQNPYAALVQATNGTFYGTTSGGGAHNCGGLGCGTVFSLSVGLGPFVETQTASGKVGAAVTILGTNLTGATSVAFNGTAAAFTVNSSGSAISTSVPVGATTGTVQVVTPSGTLSSNVPFRVP
jgi:uncharacterized repeat protein (TIGR03803 family)